jgi:hypothetical protein
VWKKIRRVGQGTDDKVAHAILHAGYLKLQTLSEYVIIIAFPLKQSCANTPQCYVVRIVVLPTLLKIVLQDFQFLSAQHLLHENDNLELRIAHLDMASSLQIL